jgi:hypothetical protein
MPRPDWRPRLSIEISAELFKRLQDQIPWGIRSQLVTVLVEEALDLIEKEGEVVTALILKRKLHARDILGIQNGGGNKDG